MRPGVVDCSDVSTATVYYAQREPEGDDSSTISDNHGDCFLAQGWGENFGARNSEHILSRLVIGRLEVHVKNTLSIGGITWIVVTGTGVDFVYAVAHMLFPDLVVG